MDISAVVLLSLPVLYVTGSLRKSVINAGASGTCFVLYFAIVIALAFVPVVRITQSVSADVSGAFFCIAPAVYLLVKKAYRYQFFIAVALIVLLSVASSFLSNSYSLPYLSYVVSVLVALIAILFFGMRAPLYTPVLIGIFCVIERVMQQMVSMYNRVVFFDCIRMASLSFVVCLFLTYLITKPRRKHLKGNRVQNEQTVTSLPRHNKG